MSLRIMTVVLAGVTLLASSGCGLTAGDLARANNNRGEGYKVVVRVPDALNLPDGAPVRIGGISVGKVHSVEAKDYEAVVTMKIRDDVKLTDQAHARLRYTTALGEMYVQLDPSAQGAPIGDGAELPREQAETAPSVEDALASASLLINGGGLGSIQTIVDELNTALEGRIPTTHSLISRLDTFLGTVTSSQREIDRILSALAASSAVLNKRESTINKALTQIRPAARTLTENTDDLVRLLKQADRLGRTMKRIVDQNSDDVQLIVEELGPVLSEVNSNSAAVLRALDGITAAAPVVEQAIPGNYGNLHAAVRIDCGSLLGSLAGSTCGAVGGSAGGSAGGSSGGGGSILDPIIGGGGSLLDPILGGLF